MSGTGGLTSTGIGTLILTGSSNCGDGSFIDSDSTLQLGNGGMTGFIAGNILNSGTLVFKRSNTYTFSGAISGPGVMEQAGSGTTIFPGNHDYIGNTLISAGELQVNGRLASANGTVASGGVLSGMGMLAGNVFNFGAVRPGTSGTSPGVMRIQSDYLQLSSGTLVIQIADLNDYSRLAVEKIAALNGTLEVDFLNGFVPTTGDEFVILTAKGEVQGKFDPVIDTLGSHLEVIYEGNEVRLFILAGPSGTIPVPIPIPSTPGTPAIPGSPGLPVSPGSTLSGTHVAALVGHPRGTAERIQNVLDMLGVPFTEVVPHIATMSKDVIFGAANIQYGELTTRLAAIRAGVTEVCLTGLPQEPMRELLGKHEKAHKPEAAPCEPLRWDIYAFASGVFSCMQNVSDLPKIKSEVGYFGAGADGRINEHISLGTYIGYQGMWSRFEKNRMQSNGVKWGLYGTADWEGFYVNAIVGGGANFLNKRRTIDLKDIVYRATGHPFVGEVDSLLGGGYEYRWNNWIFGANNSIQYTYAGMTEYKERGADTLNVEVDSQNFSSLIYSLGGNISYLWGICENIKIFPTAGLSWQHEFLNYGQEIGGAFNNGRGAPFSFHSRTGARNFALGMAGVTAQWGRVGAWAYWLSQWGGHQIYNNAVQVGLSFAF